MFSRVFLALVCALLSVSTPALAQVAADYKADYDLGRDRLQVVNLDREWRFHPGDDPHYADPTFDDSSWASIRGDHGWDEQGYKGLSGLAWYRTTIRIPAGRRRLALYVRGINDSSQIFLDGQPVGSFGDMPPNPRADYQNKRLYPLPLLPSAEPRVVTLAIRVWHWPHWAARVDGGIIMPIRFGDANFLRMLMTLNYHDETYFDLAYIVLIFLWTLTGIASLVLFTLRRDREYLWFGIYLLLLAVIELFSIYSRSHGFRSKDADLIRGLLRCAVQLTEIAFYFYLLRGKRNWLFWTAIVSAAVLTPAMHILVYTEYGNYATWNLLSMALVLPFYVWILTLLIQRTRQGLLDARLLLAPVLLLQLVSLTVTSFLAAEYLGWRGRPLWFHRLSAWPFEFSVPDVVDLLFLIAMVTIFLYRFYRTSREQEDFKREREAARTVQQILVPETLCDVPGFCIRSVYKPASEVGGDFFQILPLAVGGALIVIGDVSGKGLPAAMTVSMLVGTVRTLALYTQGPGEILAAMNQLMLGRSNGGFTTCQVLRADPNGTLTIANAGHINPYLEGKELATESGLPLGLAGEVVYAESRYQLAGTEQLTLVTDGVVEATSSTGELYGFERTAAISVESAETIAEAAQAFGQDDDITVLTLTLAAQT